MSRYTDFIPKWARDLKPSETQLDEIPITGMQPDFAPQLPTRLLPKSGNSAISAITLSEVVSQTQRIMNYVGHEVIHGIQPEFTDLRSVEPEVLEFARLEIHPFEEGSFVIPARLCDSKVEIESKYYTGGDLLKHFVDVLDSFNDPRAVIPTSIGLVQAIEDLGRIVRREADIEFTALGISGMRDNRRTISVNSEYIESVKRVNESRRSPQTVLDELTGHLIAIDLLKATFKLRLNDKSTVRGGFMPMVQEKLTACLNRQVTVSGIIELQGYTPIYIRAYSVRDFD